MSKESIRQFKVWTGRRVESPYYRVLLFYSKEDMYAHNQKRTGKSDAKFWAQASCRITYQLVKGRWRKNPCCGEVIFHAKRVGAGIVSHEMTHAALYILKLRKGFNLDRKFWDEKLAWTQGWMVTQFWRAYFRLEKRKAA